MAFGARMFKTGLAVTLALYMAMLFDFKSPVVAAIAAIFAMQPSIYRSWRYFLDQLQTSTLGAILAMLGGYFLSNQPISVGLVCIVVIMICMKLKMGETIGLTLVTVISVMEASGQWDFALNRFILTIIGIVSAFLINILVFPPKPKEQYITRIHMVFGKMSLLLRTAISHEMKDTVYRSEKKELESSIKSLSDKYNLFEEEQKKLKKAKYSQARQLVVYKQLLQSLRKGYDVLDAVENHYFQTERTEKTDVDFDHNLERLMKYHEHILWKFEGKLKPNEEEAETMAESNEEFMEQVMSGPGAAPGGLRLSVVAAAMYDYGYQLDRLNRVAEQINRISGEQESEETLLSWLRK
ncbi:aromatic acid exporter family protein [Paenibacillus sp. JCM 10914]|uniref:FUSC family protein n=1 Tax=Paenibacillus sp. JCM 10914 TaxID=1236974 RepID=UPI0003CC7694|nr:aromatic acid exporter family protein [Paenibacillus sp. JCM 10914]GAE08547.1 putative lipoprotein SAV1865 [Paenibacillus sp. JCM 10914]